MMGSTSKQVGPYRISTTLGEGHFSKVKLGKHGDTGESVAIKILDKQAMEAAGAEAEVMHEVNIMKQVEHPNVVNLREIIASRESIFLVMEYVPGGDLFDHVAKHGAMKEEAAKAIFCQLIDGVEFCHMNGIFHRDIKAENVLLTSNGHAKLADFGLGALTSSHQDGLIPTFAGTANFAAPEVLARRGGYAGGPADIWSLGVLLFFVTAARAPFLGPEFESLRARIARAEYRVPLWYSDSLSSFLKLIFQVQPAKRAGFEELRGHPWLKPAAEQKRWQELNPVPSNEDLSKVMVAPRQMTMEESESLQQAVAKRPGSAGSSMNAFQLMASALDISAILEDRMESRSLNTRFLSKAQPGAVIAYLEEEASTRGGRLVRSNDCRYKVVAAQTQKGKCTANVDFVTVMPGLLMVQFGKSAGSTAAFHQFFNELLEDPRCKKIMAGG